ncbi:phospholipid-transporting ATPase ABCA1-like isoform X2 [Macrosteles quadrilineatus]|uniref:phospholipid-transporting ATPase ABCA1-like isoform X2 n=1 Tax=Macrosteles quadrilineatus TaxID=74068 RepID=UPI0023E0F5F5|nr:phospholipid-transporting ATPase ABCA1-like isoform X2 [Macrosteles quadrilineatus]
MATSSQYRRVHDEELTEVKMWQKVKVLLWKVYILRKRHFVLTFLELLVPVVLFWLVVHFKNMLPEQKEIVTDKYPKLYSNITRLGNYKIAFSPSNSITESVMKIASEKIIASGCNVTLVSKHTENEVVNWLKAEYVKDVKNKTRDYFFWVTSPKGVGVIFLDTSYIENLTYTLRTTRGILETDEDSLYGQKNGYGISKYSFSGFLTVQSAIDQAYLKVVQNITIPEGTKITTLPYVKYAVVDLVQLLMPTIISLGFTFVMPSLLKEVVEERTSGIKEMMKIMGLSPLLNWLSWMVYSLLVYLPVTVAITFLLTIDSGTGPPIDANFFYVWGMFVLFTISFLTLILAISTFFTNGTIAMIAGELIWYGVTILLDTFVVSYPDQYNISVQILTCLWPSIALVWTFRTIHNFHRSGHPWTLGNLFDDGAGGGRVSVGLALLMLIVDIGVYSCVTWYMDNVKPGPYGRAKPLGFIFKYFKKKRQATNTVVSQKESQENFEKVPKDISVGIKIENLVKTYSKGTVTAVRNVNLDIYKGNITALLGHNGAGKTSLMSMLAGFFSPTSGQVIVNNQNIFENMVQFRSSLGLCPQHNLLFTYFTALEHLIFFGMLKGMTMSQARQKSKTMLKTLKIYDRKDYTIAKLSGGMRRKVSLAIALLGDPEVVLLDEPTSGMDPESRRQVWDILLTLRGQKTIIFTTHFMEEADVLGDRIAIMNHGKVSCYGTPMYLKRLYGKGYQLHVSKRDTAPVNPIVQVIERHTTNATMKLSSPSQLSFNVRAEDSPQFPSLFSALDGKRDNLGVIGVSINCTTIDDVFISVIGGDSKERKSSDCSIEALESKIVKLSGRDLLVQQIKALVYKRMLIRVRSWISTIIYVVVPVALMAATVLQLMYQDYSPVQNKLKIALSSFPKVSVAVQTDNSTVSEALTGIITSGKASVISIPTIVDLEKYFISQLNGQRGLIQYERSMIAGYQSLSNILIGGYSQYFDHSFALVLNMMANILILLNNKSASITTYCHPIAVFDTVDECDRAMDASDHVSSFPLKVIFLSLGLLMMTMSLIPFPLKERVTRVKQLQLMSGVSPLLYWLVMFLCDFALCLVTTLLMVCMILVFQQNGVFTTSGYIGTVALIIVLFGCSGSLFAYFFSFFVKSSVKATVSFVVFNLAVGLFGATFLAILDRTYTSFGMWRFILSFNPLFSATSALIHLFTVMYLDGTCLQCGYNCVKTDPFNFIEAGQNSSNPHGINSFLIFLVVDIFVYSGLVLTVEYGMMKRLKFLISTLWIKHAENNYKNDEDVKQEKEEVLTYNKIGGLLKNTAILQVYSLGKKYTRDTTAVHDVTFQVGRGECFGLLGVNGAGKTTTFKMLTGEEIPDKGDANVYQLSLIKNKSMFLSHVGYCPQFDPLSSLLSGKEMLRVFALVRGIPMEECESEVHKWIQILGMQEYADRPCGTYSGGNKRKLSTAIAFIGSPPVVFLDEPTSGVDPLSRRRLWDIVAECQRTGQAIVLTSHSMEECEALCSRLTIMVGGRMKCIGSPLYLKHKFGQGYTIKVKMSPTVNRKDSLNSLKENMKTHFKNCVLKDEHLGLLHYHLQDHTEPLAKIFQKMEDLKKKHTLIEDYDVSPTTLEEVFMSFARQSVKGCD